jgi:hypothetical protein
MKEIGAHCDSMHVISFCNGALLMNSSEQQKNISYRMRCVLGLLSTNECSKGSKSFDSLTKFMWDSISNSSFDTEAIEISYFVVFFNFFSKSSQSIRDLISCISHELGAFSNSNRQSNHTFKLLFFLVVFKILTHSSTLYEFNDEIVLLAFLKSSDAKFCGILGLKRLRQALKSKSTYILRTSAQLYGLNNVHGMR